VCHTIQQTQSVICSEALQRKHSMAFPVCEALQRSRAMAISCVPRHSANSKCNMQQGTATIKCHGHTLCAEHCINHVPWHSVCAKHCQITCHGNTLCAEHCINHVPWPYPVCHTIQQIQSVICSEALQQSRAMSIPCVRSTASITCHGHTLCATPFSKFKV